jgi:hypothetical protein
MPYRFHNAAMSVGFGFSIGDFIAAIELVGSVSTPYNPAVQPRLTTANFLSQLLSLETLCSKSKV